MVQEFTPETFKVDEGNYVVDFWAPWCGPCKMMGPVFEELSSEMDGVTFAKVNVDEHQELAQKHGVQGIPAIFFFKDGEKVGESIGFVQKDDLKKKIEEAFN